ncbi:MAG: hypothetical protein ACKOYL_11070 [Actinomycetota bacterium]
MGVEPGEIHVDIQFGGEEEVAGLGNDLLSRKVGNAFGVARVAPDNLA